VQTIGKVNFSNMAVTLDTESLFLYIKYSQYRVSLR